jgi:alkylation response protein AidB-like acyl-CoA dehydrogenase
MCGAVEESGHALEAESPMLVEMDLGLGQEWYSTFTNEVEHFAQAHEAELVRCTRAAEFPREIYAEMGKRGWIGPYAPTERGGLGGGVKEYCVVLEAVARHNLVSPQISAQGQRWLLDWGTDVQVERYLGPITRGELIFSESISEPGVGSSLKLMKSTARRDGTDWVLNGRKTHVNLGAQCDVTLFYAIAEQGLTAFLVDTTEPGVVTRRTEPIGVRLLPTADVDFSDVRVSDSALLGVAGGGMQTFFSTFNVSRLGNASELIGWGRRALAQAIRYARVREVGSNVVTDFQGIQWTVANLYGALYGASLARNHAAELLDRGGDQPLATTLAKKLAIDAAESAVNEAFALIGGHGLYGDVDYGQLMHDVKVMRIAGGSLEVFRNHIARSVLQSHDLAGLA